MIILITIMPKNTIVKVNMSIDVINYVSIHQMLLSKEQTHKSVTSEMCH